MIGSLLNVRKLGGAIICAWLGFTFWTGYLVFSEKQAQIYEDNGLIENMQALLLMVACIVYLLVGLRENRLNKLIPLFCSLLCFSFLLRELDVEKFDLPGVLIYFGHGAGRDAILAIALFSIFTYAALNRSYYKKAAIHFARSGSGWLLVSGGVFLVIGNVFEKSDGIPHFVFFEEIAELFGYVLILLSSIYARSYASCIGTHSHGQDGALE